MRQQNTEITFQTVVKFGLSANARELIIIKNKVKGHYYNMCLNFNPWYERERAQGREKRI